MEINEIDVIISRLINFWNRQNILVSAKDYKEIEKLEQRNKLTIPIDFKLFYSKVNGMKEYYPNYTDDEGFLIYPAEALILATEEFKESNMKNVNRVWIFANYMQRSWYYGVEIIDENNYMIGIIPEESVFKPITNSLGEFLELYMENSDRLYDYS